MNHPTFVKITQKSPCEKRITVKFLSDEYPEFERIMKERGFVHVSDFIRDCISKATGIKFATIPLKTNGHTPRTVKTNSRPKSTAIPGLVLDQLIKANGRWVTSTEISKALNISSVRATKELQDLIDKGEPVERAKDHRMCAKFRWIAEQNWDDK